MKEHLVGHLTRFAGSEEAAREKIHALQNQNPGINNAEIFRKITNGLGRGKSHVSGAREGTMKGS